MAHGEINLLGILQECLDYVAGIVVLPGRGTIPALRGEVLRQDIRLHIWDPALRRDIPLDQSKYRDVIKRCAGVYPQSLTHVKDTVDIYILYS